MHKDGKEKGFGFVFGYILNHHVRSMLLKNGLAFPDGSQSLLSLFFGTVALVAGSLSPQQEARQTSGDDSVTSEQLCLHDFCREDWTGQNATSAASTAYW